MENIVEIRELSIYYGSTCALNNINLNIKKRDFLGVIGPNGGGKTTLLKAMLGFIKPKSGSILVNGKCLPLTKEKIAYVPQYTKFDRSFPIKVIDVVLMGLLDKSKLFLHKYSKKDHEIALKVMEQLELSDLRERQIGQLSGGQLQKVLIARSLVHKPNILLLDEPTASMDARARTNIYKILQDLNQEITIVVVTHDTSFISSHIKTIACLNQQLYYHGEPALDEALVQQIYGCPVEILAHGLPHRVLKEHGDNNND